MHGKAHKRAAEKAFKQWGKLHFNTLFDSQLMPTPLHATLRLPLFTADTTPSSSTAAATVDVHLSTNHHAVTEWWQTEYSPFLHVHRGWKEESNVVASTHIIATAHVAAHIGPPASSLGYPAYLAAEARQWTEGVLRGETYAYDYADTFNGTSAIVAPPPPPADAPYLSPVRWLRQPLLDGFVAQRLTAHAGVTTGALLDARRRAAALGQQLPPVDVSPFYGASELLDRWCIFGEPSALLPAHAAPAQAPPLSSAKDDAAAAHHRRVAELAVAAAILPSYNAAWLNGAVVADQCTGRCVLIVGPRSCGKTTLALHCVAPAANNNTGKASSRHDDHFLQLVAAEHFFLGAGTPVRRMLHAPLFSSSNHANNAACPQVFTCAVPHRVKVGIGAVLGTLRPNSALTAVVELPSFLHSNVGQRAFLTNTDAAIWNMSLHYRVPLQNVITSSLPAWQPAGVNALAGVVLLDWNVEELASSADTTPVQTRTRRLPLHAGGLSELLVRGRDFLFRGHYLLRSAYDDAADGPARLSALFEHEWAAHPPTTAAAAAPSLHCIEGSVNFDVATELVKRLLTE